MEALLRFTLLESGLSAFFSVFFGAWLARIWMRLGLRNKARWEAVLFFPFFFPPLLVVLAVIGFYGQRFLGFDVYGLGGIVLAHMILNIPLCFLLILNQWRRVPVENIMQALALGDVFNLVERNVLYRAVPFAFALVFLYSMLSFTIVLTLGGGPSSSTLEFAIFQALRYEFDLVKAFLLSALQAGLGVVLLLVIRRSLEAELPNTSAAGIAFEEKGLDRFILVVFSVLWILPMGFVFARGLLAFPELFATLKGSRFLDMLWNSFYTSLGFAIVVNFWALILVIIKKEWVAWGIAALSPLAIATFLILLLRPIVNPFDWGVGIVIFLQVLTLSPLFVAMWKSAIDEISPEEKMGMAILSSHVFVKFQVFWWPKLRYVFVRAFLIAFALGLGDLALYPLFAPSGFVNLPMGVLQLMSSYQIDEAMALMSGILVLIFGALLLAFRVQETGKDQEVRYVSI